MNLIFRLLRIIILGWSAGKGKNPGEEFMKPSRIALRCWPTDMDLNFHMNNGRYLSIMDLGRVDLMLQSGLLKTIIFQNKWMPVIAAGTVRYRKAIDPFERFELETQVIGWDDRFVYLEQRFFGASGRVKAIGLVQAAMTSKKGRVPTGDLIATCGLPADSQQAPPEYVADWLKMLNDWPIEEIQDHPPMAA